MTDKLDHLFRAQLALMDQYHDVEAANNAPVVPLSELTGIVAVDLDDRVVQARLKELAWRMTEELAEAMNHLRNRPWRLENRPTDRAAYREELIDCVHFFVELLITSGITPTELVEEYDRKHQINQDRLVPE